MAVNWTYIMQNFIAWSTQGYITAMGFLFWPVFFASILGYIYLKNQSLLILAAGILIIFAVFGNAIMGVDAFVNILYIGVSLIFTVVILWFFIRRRRG